MKTLRNILIALGVTFTAYVLIEGNNPTFSLPDWDLDSFLLLMIVIIVLFTIKKWKIKMYI